MKAVQMEVKYARNIQNLKLIKQDDIFVIENDVFVTVPIDKELGVLKDKELKAEMDKRSASDSMVYLTVRAKNDQGETIEVAAAELWINFVSLGEERQISGIVELESKKNGVTENVG